MDTRLFTPLVLRGLSIPNRIFVSPMCQYSSTDGVPNDWHLVHLGSRAVGGAGLVIAEATAVCPEGRITPYDTGLWNEAQATAYRRITDFIKAQGSVAGIQIAHAGRKASTDAPWLGGHPIQPAADNGWVPEAPSAKAFSPAHTVPHELDEAGIERIKSQFVASARLALEAGFQVAELHMAHGYLLHSFLSPLSNHRDDAWGGSLENRARLPLEIARAVRAEWPAELPVFVRISASDWVDDGWDLAQSVQLAIWLREAGIDLIDCSSGGLTPDARIPAAPGFQTLFAQTVRAQARIHTGAVGLITSPEQAEHLLVTEQADAVLLARELLRDPYWPLHAAHALGAEVDWPVQYQRAKPR
ncbi:oxidoreductase [Acidihalobacter aeolianus]|uniref:Oxidoreductase n=1 Tax=Acidihalobacter aeolianus TaxID=2792603 RepID=A0A1D8K865_9GAMM|nr:NADH:flavin oxidoreductase/NADH oxidase [Acidihalobacter aeolianus]AOV17161.1 oxidoreductase [Acidihalobacter aeolianus]